MTFDERLKTHIGGLIRLETELYWFNTRSWDGVKGRVCLLLDTITHFETGRPAPLAASSRSIDPTAAIPFNRDRIYALLLINDQPKWVLTSKEDTELIK